MVGLRSHKPPPLLKKRQSSGSRFDLSSLSSPSGLASPRKQTRGSLKASRDVYIRETYPHLIISGMTSDHFANYAPESDNSTEEDVDEGDEADEANDAEIESPHDAHGTSSALEDHLISQDASQDEDYEPNIEPIRKRRRLDVLAAAKPPRSPRRRETRPTRQSGKDFRDSEPTSQQQSASQSLDASDSEIVESKEGAAGTMSQDSLMSVPKRTLASRLLEAEIPAGSRSISRAGTGTSQSPPATRDASPVPSLPASPLAPASRAASPSTLKGPDEIDDEDLPPPFLEIVRSDLLESTFPDRAAEILATEFAPIPNPKAFTKALSSHDPSSRKTETLFKLAVNTQRALLEWQNQYLQLDARTAPLQVPPKKPATGGRVPMEASHYERSKEVELFGHVLGVEGTMARPDGSVRTRQVAQAANTVDDLTGGRALRRRHADASIAESGAAPSEDDNGAVGKRTRKPVRRFDAGSNNGTAGRKRKEANGEDDGVSGPTPKRSRLEEIVSDARYAQSPTPDSVVDTAGDGTDVERAPATRGRGGRGRGRGGRGRGRGNSTRGGALAARTAMASNTASVTQPFGADTTTRVLTPLPDDRQAAASPSVAGADSILSEYPVMYSRSTDVANASDETLQHVTINGIGSSLALGPKVGSQSEFALEPAIGGLNQQRRQRVKSEKRSESMTAWWAARKKKAAEEKIKELRDKGLLDANGAAIPGAGAHHAAYMLGATPMMQFAPQPPQHVWSLPQPSQQQHQGHHQHVNLGPNLGTRHVHYGPPPNHHGHSHHHHHHHPSNGHPVAPPPGQHVQPPPPPHPLPPTQLQHHPPQQASHQHPPPGHFSQHHPDSIYMRHQAS